MYNNIFGIVTDEQPGDPNASLLLTSEMAVFGHHFADAVSTNLVKS